MAYIIIAVINIDFMNYILYPYSFFFNYRMFNFRSLKDDFFGF